MPIFADGSFVLSLLFLEMQGVQNGILYGNREVLSETGRVLATMQLKNQPSIEVISLHACKRSDSRPLTGSNPHKKLTLVTQPNRQNAVLSICQTNALAELQCSEKLSLRVITNLDRMIATLMIPSITNYCVILYLHFRGSF